MAVLDFASAIYIHTSSIYKPGRHSTFNRHIVYLYVCSGNTRPGYHLFGALPFQSDQSHPRHQEQVIILIPQSYGDKAKNQLHIFATSLPPYLHYTVDNWALWSVSRHENVTQRRTIETALDKKAQSFAWKTPRHTYTARNRAIVRAVWTTGGEYLVDSQEITLGSA